MRFTARFVFGDDLCSHSKVRPFPSPGIIPQYMEEDSNGERLVSIVRELELVIEAFNRGLLTRRSNNGLAVFQRRKSN